MATLTTQTITRAGLTPTFAACAGGGDKVKPTDRTFIVVKNGHTSPQTVTIATPGNVEGQPIEDLAVPVANASEEWIGPISPSLFRNSVDGLASLTYSGVTALTIAVVQI
jgi:hypothetical protein